MRKFRQSMEFIDKLRSISTGVLATSIVLLIGIVTFSILPSQVNAAVLDSVVIGVKDAFENGVETLKQLVGEDKNIATKELAVTSLIELVPNGDQNKNSEIDSGDTVRFIYTISNTTDKGYEYAILKTNINRAQLHFIHSLRGATGLTDDGKTIVFKNLRINPLEERTISFDARVNYSEKDTLLSTTPELLTSEKKSLFKSEKKEILAKKLEHETLKKLMENRGVTLRSKKSTTE